MKTRADLLDELGFRWEKELRRISRDVACQAPCGCDRLADSRQEGLLVCNAHASKKRRGLESYAPLKRVLPDDAHCEALDDQGTQCPAKPSFRRDDLIICSAHYFQWKREKPYTAPRRRRSSRQVPEGALCQVPCGCSRLATHKQNELFVCDTHRQQGARRKKYTPIASRMAR